MDIVVKPELAPERINQDSLPLTLELAFRLDLNDTDSYTRPIVMAERQINKLLAESRDATEKYALRRAKKFLGETWKHLFQATLAYEKMAREGVK